MITVLSLETAVAVYQSTWRNVQEYLLFSIEVHARLTVFCVLNNLHLFQLDKLVNYY